MYRHLKPLREPDEWLYYCEFFRLRYSYNNSRRYDGRSHTKVTNVSVNILKTSKMYYIRQAGLPGIAPGCSIQNYKRIKHVFFFQKLNLYNYLIVKFEST